MKNNLFINEEITISEHELEMKASHSGGPGGQNVNKSNTRITIRWNVKNTHALNDEQKNRVMNNLQSQLTTEGDLIVHNNETRSQLQNKIHALHHLKEIILNALIIPKERVSTKMPRSIRETILKHKKERSSRKKERSKKIFED